jgi:CBS domain containing-hemolysin-like protein
MEPGSESLGLTLANLIIVIILVTLNAFFVAAEFSLVSVRRTRIEELVAQGKQSAAAVKKALEDPDRFIAATQLGITIASLGLGWAGEPALAHLIDPVVALLPIPADWVNISAHGVSAAISFLIITFLHVVLGELTPKSIALQRTESTALFIIQPMIFTEWLLKPAIWALNGTGNLVLRLLGFRASSGHELVHSVEEIKMVMAASTDQGVLANTEYDMFDAIIDLRQQTVRQLMIPRTEMTTIPADSTLKDLVDQHKDDPYSRLPAYESDIDHIIGVLYVRDVISEIAKGNLQLPIKHFIRDAIFIPDSAKINAALNAFRDKRQHLAIVLDEYGGTAGLLTLEDILEEIAGEVPDQFDQEEEPEILQQSDNAWEVSGLTLIEDINDELNVVLRDENYDTIGGFVMGKLERIPRIGDEVTVDHIHFRVKRVDGMRIDRLLITKS